MSGGHFDYNQDRISEIADEVRRVIKRNRDSYSIATITEFENGVDALEVAAIYAQRIDWLLSGDDGEDSFHRRLREELNEQSGVASGDDMILPATEGITLRDYFAGQADVPWNVAFDSVTGKVGSAIAGSAQLKVTQIAERIASMKYALADAMLAEREKAESH